MAPVLSLQVTQPPPTWPTWHNGGPRLVAGYGNAPRSWRFGKNAMRGLRCQLGLLAFSWIFLGGRSCEYTFGQLMSLGITLILFFFWNLFLVWGVCKNTSWWHATFPSGGFIFLGRTFLLTSNYGGRLGLILTHFCWIGFVDICFCFSLIYINLDQEKGSMEYTKKLAKLGFVFFFVGHFVDPFDSTWEG